jgi:hypothetical protein
MCGRDHGVIKNVIAAHTWFNIAAISGKSKNASKNRDIVAGKMTPDQFAEAEKLARECVRKKYKRCDVAVRKNSQFEIRSNRIQEWRLRNCSA